MSVGEPRKQTIYTDKYQKKAGYISKTYKLKKDIVDEFKEACDRNGVSQASVLSEYMKAYTEMYKSK